MEENKVYTVPDKLVFRNWAALTGPQTRNLLIRNTTDTALDVYVSYPFSTTFQLHVGSSEGWTFSDAPAWAACSCPPNGAVKVTVQLQLPQHPTSANYADALVVVVGSTLLTVPLRAIKQSLDPLGGEALAKKLEELKYDPPPQVLEAACAKYLQLFAEKTGISAQALGVRPPTPPPLDDEAEAARLAAAEEVARAAAAEEAARAAAAEAAAKAEERRRLEALMPPTDFSTDVPDTLEQVAEDAPPYVMEAKPIRNIGSTLFLAAVPTMDTVQRLAVEKSNTAVQRKTGAAGSQRAVSSAGKKGVFQVNGQWVNARGQPVEAPWLSSSASNSDNNASGSDAVAAAPDAAAAAREAEALRSAALAAAMQELGLSDLPPPPHLAQALSDTAQQGAEAAGQDTERPGSADDRTGGRDVGAAGSGRTSRTGAALSSSGNRASSGLASGPRSLSSAGKEAGHKSSATAAGSVSKPKVDVQRLKANWDALS